MRVGAPKVRMRKVKDSRNLAARPLMRLEVSLNCVGGSGWAKVVLLTEVP